MSEQPVPARQLALITVILAFAAGATDAFAFLQLSGVFTANMTGNLILAGLVHRDGYSVAIYGITAAILVFALTIFVALRYATVSARSHRTVVVLAVSVAAQTAVLAIWVAVGSPRPPMLVVILIILSTVAMACQTAVARRIDASSGVTTTYVTGTITSLMADAADRRPQAAGVRIGVVLALVLGALCGALLIGVDPAYGALLAVVAAAVATVLLAVRSRGGRGIHVELVATKDGAR